VTIHLPEKREQFIRSLVAGGRFASESEVVEEALSLLEQRYQGLEPATRAEADIPADRTGQQLENLKRLCQKLDALPTATVTDGLTNRDHDRILYGR
jgi:putative addiction module CopG family antidote